MGENENIVYDIASQEVKTDLPVDSEKEDFNFEFIGFTADEYHSGRKPYVFYATMTEKKRKSLNDQLITIEKAEDDKKVNFNWADIVWHFDLYVSEWERYEEEGIWLPGRIYFVKADNDEELITPSNFNEKAKSLKQVQKVNQRTQSDIVNDAIATLQQAWEIIDLIKDGTYMPFDVMKAQALKQYREENKTHNIIIPTIKILFTSPRWYSVHEGYEPIELTEQLETVFRIAVNNFKKSVEGYTNHNVIVEPDIFIIENTSETPIIGIGGETVIPEKPYEGNYTTFERIAEAISQKLEGNYYNACICAVTGDANPHVGITSLKMFNESSYRDISTKGMGFCSTNIINFESEYEKAMTEEYMDSEFCYLLTSGFMLHEWQHTLEDGYTLAKIFDGTLWDSTIQRVPPPSSDFDNFVYPQGHCYQYVANLEYPHYDYPDYCEGNTDEQQTPDSREDMLSYAKAVLSGELLYVNGDEQHYLGMFPKMWYLTPETFATGVIWDFRQQNQGEGSQSE